MTRPYESYVLQVSPMAGMSAISFFLRMKRTLVVNVGRFGDLKDSGYVPGTPGRTNPAYGRLHAKASLLEQHPKWMLNDDYDTTCCGVCPKTNAGQFMLVRRMCHGGSWL
jgi:hypothetical protein